MQPGCPKCFDAKHGAVAVVSTAIVRQVLETCAAAGVEKVIAADDELTHR